jgi:UTP--glucose-1-phosphate uridylyltransferase
MQITQAVLPVAGLGTRFLPWTKVVPKELLPIGNQPIIGLLVDECLSIGITDICFVISHGKEAIPQYFYQDPALEAELRRRGKEGMLQDLRMYDEVRFHVVYQGEQLGDGHAILQAASWVNTDTVAVLFGDDLIIGQENGLQQLHRGLQQLAESEAMKSEKMPPAMLCLQNVDRSQVSKYGIVEVASDDGRLKRIKSMVEKPKPDQAPSTLGIVGKYLIPRQVFDALQTCGTSQGGEIRLIDALIHLLPQGMPMYGYEFKGKRLDTGTPEGYKEAVVMLG